MSDLLNPPIPQQTSDRFQWGNLQGVSNRLILANLAKNAHAPLLVIAPDPQTAAQLERELHYFLLKTDVPIYHFPDWETLPYDNFSPHQDIISERLLVLSRCQHLRKGVMIVPITTLLHRLPPTDFIISHSLVLRTGESFRWDIIRPKLIQAGYHCVSQVMTHGEFTTRGSIIDIFPMGMEQPIRIDLDHDSIDTLRLFDPQTQRSDKKIDMFECLPAHEFPLTPEAISHFRQEWRAEFSGDPSQCMTYQDISNGTASQGIEYYLPLFFDQLSSLLDYLPSDTIVARPFDLSKACEDYWTDIQFRYEQYRHDRLRPLLSPQKLFIPTDRFFNQLNQFSQVILTTDTLEKTHRATCNFNTQLLPDITLQSRGDVPLEKLSAWISAHPQERILFCAESPGRRELLLPLLQRIHLQPKTFEYFEDFINDTAQYGMTVAPLQTGMWQPNEHWCLIAESQLFGHQVMQRRYRHKTSLDVENPIRDLVELTLDAPIVHIDHGVGRYKGLVSFTIEGTTAEYMMIEYADNDKLYVPVASLHLISQYSASNVQNAPLHKLGTEQWEKAKKKAQERAYDVAAELLDIQAKRVIKPGSSFNLDANNYFQFASQFPFEETPDQAKAIDAVLQDLQNDKPMDRLVCGDVGFGKTEVALRAAFVCVENQKQVAVLVPTTLLAQQHFETFSDRFADWPVRIEVISRFRSAKEQEKVLKELAEGKVDIIIGTHKLLNEDIKYHNLGLVIIDEEHRFGVRQKERLKAIRAEVDLLTLTATPIPRTMNMALSTLRDLSIIATPPAKRRSIKTFVREHNPALILEAVQRELMRGGQIYYLHNEVDTIEKTARELSEALPNARIAIAHGQMRERELEQVMSDFYHQRFQILVCTTIIETGIDIPTANTIIIDRADKFGLAQLHQLRGRVGRSHHQAYAYCLTPHSKKLTPDAVKRLDALESLEELGSGFTLATHDLEIRGAGDLLGEEQSGNMHAIGFSLYMEILERAVKALKLGKNITVDMPIHQGAEIDLQISALIPDDYLPDVHSRLVLYKRIANASDLSTLQDIQVEMIDRFGLLPESTQNLFKMTELKLLAKPIGIRKIEASSKGGKILFDPSPNIDPERIIKMIRLQPRHFKLSGSQEIKFMFDMPDADSRIKQVSALIQQLQ